MMVAAAAVTSERGPFGVKVMEHGKDYFTDKAPFTTLAQLAAAREAMLAQGLNIPMIGLAKRIEEIVLPGENESLLLDRHSPALHVLQRVRDESHRFAIIHHRTLRGRASIASRLDGVPGVGEKRRRAILKQFKTVENLMAMAEAAAE